ncbi:dna mismatch repair protein [Diplodia corticola]|uniref:Dna mismatch repair protein n=1 Tax=Diplodia corticola TaxID=236234 RepID=A0A1J9RPW6_9PEZI|nr:dna mismatch repair protein [Diplodia corticola]OJD29956.1 dna mismatch repair protein [Diplodia corticola]
MNLEPQHDVTHRQRAQRPIAPLPPDVVAQVKSSTVITSLAIVVLGLVENSLDSGATSIEITVDARRGGCTVEDDGLGILPSEFREGGGLGQPYCTSKHDSSDPVYGRYGTFLASVAALSLLTVTSHHCLHRSHNTVTLHRSQIISRQIPAPRQQELGFPDHGTRVMVRDLFGSMPVRVKQRATMIDDRGEQERQWESLKKSITALLLAWHHPVSLRLRDAENGRNLVLNANRKQPISLAEKLPADERKINGALRPLIAMLSQASYITPDEWSSWVPVSASTHSVSIKGAISVKPAPSRCAQFLSVGIKPIFSGEGNNELFDEINRLFNHSSFGIVEDEHELDEREKERRSHDKRYKTDGPTNRQLRGGRKGIDRWPKFCLHIGLADASGNEDDVLSSESRLHPILEVLRAVITQWLQVNHFRPRQRPSRKGASRPESVSSRASTPTSQGHDELQSQSRHGGSASELAETRLSKGQKRKKSSDTSSGATTLLEPDDVDVSSDWSKIKSAKPSFYKNIWGSKRSRSSASTTQTTPATVIEPGSARASTGGTGTSSTFFQADPIMPGDLGSLPPSIASTPQEMDIPDNEQTSETNHSQSTGSGLDSSIKWTDPHSKETYTIDSRTGTVINQEERRTKTAPSEPSRAPASISAAFNKSLSLSRRVASAPGEPDRRTWLGDFLAGWDNPVFRTQAPAIPQVSLPEFSEEVNGLLHGRSRHFSHADINKAFSEASALGAYKLSKQALRMAKVVAQVDKKFILVVMQATSASARTIHERATAQPKQLLVLIDQHAADERCRVEELFAELCLPNPSAEAKECRSSHGHMSRIKTSAVANTLYFELSAQEARLLEMYASHFSDWGVVYDLNRSGTRHILVVKALPPGVAERCEADPKLLLSLLRSEAWKLAEERTRAPPGAAASAATAKGSTSKPAGTGHGSMGATATAEEPHSSSPSWPAQIGSCPQGILALLNSRACRSAVMFNDELPRAGCEELVARLAGCAFPFQCAHGRPSMVPLVELGASSGGVVAAAASTTAAATAAAQRHLARGKDQTAMDPGDDVAAGGLGVFAAGRGRGSAGAADGQPPDEQKSGFVEAFRHWRQ